MTRAMTTAVALAGMAFGAAGAYAQSVEFRIVERQGQQAIITPVGTTATTDAVLNFAVQARVVGGGPTTGIGYLVFNVHIVGEPDANGTLSKMLISNNNGTYAPNVLQTSNATVGRGGIAAPYAYLAGISGQFSGLINVSGGTFVNTPDQEIGLILASPTGGAMLLVTDVDGDANPDTYPGTGTTAAVDPGLARLYFGAGGNWVDVYRFKYRVTNTTTSRVLHIVLDTQNSPNLPAQVFDQWGLAGGTWGPGNAVNTSVTAMPLDVPIASVGACCDTGTGACTIVDGAGCAMGTFAASGTCLPSPCPVTGACCTAAAACSVGAPGACVGTWSAGATCGPSPCEQLAACCDEAGMCTLQIPSACAGYPTAYATCTPNPCPQPGACCSNDGTCAMVIRGACDEIFQGKEWFGGTCAPSPCVGACCRAGFACAATRQPACAGNWIGGRTCTPGPCPPPGNCCALDGTCAVTYQAACTTMWTGGGTCGTGACLVLGACCQRDVCALLTRAACDAGHWQYRGDGVACLPAGTFNACCGGNFDGLDGVQVADIFGFLNAWFSQNLRADYDQNGMLTIYDIFGFLGGWFNGCG